VIGDLDEKDALVAAEALSARGFAVIGASLDVADEASIVAFADQAVAEYGTVDIWVNNAGIYPMSSAVDMPIEQWDLVVDVNLRGTFLGGRESARRMIADGHGGVIVNIASTAGYRGLGPAHYVSSKHAVRGLTKTLAVELGPHGIRVLAVAPGVIDTPGLEASGKAFDVAQDELLAAMTRTDPLGRPGVGDDIARVVLFCASDLSMLMTGSTIPVEGGALAV
jgi:NAD(P)-dependent dehydrogenase (short-subunit alcohol dehydrogenase family)